MENSVNSPNGNGGSFIYLHAGAVTLVRVGEPAVSCDALVHVDVLNADVDSNDAPVAEKHNLNQHKQVVLIPSEPLG